MTLSQTSVSTDAKGMALGADAYWGNVTLPVVSRSHTVSSVSSSVSLTTAFIAQTSTQGFVTPPNFEAEAEWRTFQVPKPTDPAYEPARTPLGAKLRRWRAQYIEAGGRLLTWEEVEREVAERRGGVESGADGADLC